MFTKSEAIYDAIYSAMKDYANEAEQIHALIQQYKQSSGNRLLDVACGTGGHIPFLRQHYSVEGLDLDEQMLAIARQRNPGLTFHHADMVDFGLDHQFDAIICMFSSIGYVKTVPKLYQAVQTMRHHLLAGGVVIIEPWLTPQTFIPGYIGAVFVNQPDLKIARMNTTEVKDGISVMDFHYLVATPQGIEHFTERHEMGLFSHKDYMGAFQASDLDVVYDDAPDKLTGRGLYIGVLR
ncbi:MAG TPA: class I SAM-dependent methyltransferase [Ktedonobacteraceae bacterium]|jgi:SAM-dependent methyltransferase|nr:class I SAM-dependent methyltransferase [Ktedonobacteraceae bacterium]